MNHSIISINVENEKKSQRDTYDIEDERDIIKILYQLYVIGSFMAIKE